MAVKQVRRRRRKKWALVAGMIFAAAVLGVSLFFQFVNPDAVSADGSKAKEPWVVKVGDEEAFVVASEEEGQAVIDGIKDYYSTEAADKSNITLSPQMTLEKRDLQWKDRSQPLVDSDEAVAQTIVTNRVGDPLVTVTITEQLSETEPIDYKIQYRDSNTLDEGEVGVVSKGKKGKRVVTKEIVRANGKVLKEKTISTVVEQKPAARIIEKGAASETKAASNINALNTTKTTRQLSTAKVQTTMATTEASKVTETTAPNKNIKKKTTTESSVSESKENSRDNTSASSDKTASKGKATGEDVVEYALKFVGNPYVYGGTSLTNGTDCSGFTKGVYKKFGITLPRTSKAQRSSGRGVSYSKAKPGDLVCYSGHVAIYIGKGKIVHASTPSSGIKVSKATYRKILTVRRIIE